LVIFVGWVERNHAVLDRSASFSYKNVIAENKEVSERNPPTPCTDSRDGGFRSNLDGLGAYPFLLVITEHSVHDSWFCFTRPTPMHIVAPKTPLLPGEVPDEA